MSATSAKEQPAHDDERFARLYRQHKSVCVGYARRLLASSGQNRYLCAFDAEEFYDAAWETYFNRRQYLDEAVDHVARINTMIRERIADERRRSQARKRAAPGGVESALDPEGLADDHRALDQRLVDQEQLRQLLARVRNPADVRALVDHELRGLTFDEIGAKEGISAEAARRRARRAVEQARRLVHEPRGGSHD